MDYCVGDLDCFPEEEALSDCLGRGSCNDVILEGIEPACLSACDGTNCENLKTCECSGPCNDGHSATVSCDIDASDHDGGPRLDCRCFFDRELVGECTTYSPGACRIEYSCCRGWFAAD
jgi:hypothetical protein